MSQTTVRTRRRIDSWSFLRKKILTFCFPSHQPIVHWSPRYQTEVSITIYLFHLFLLLYELLRCFSYLVELFLFDKPTVKNVNRETAPWFTFIHNTSIDCFGNHAAAARWRFPEDAFSWSAWHFNCPVVCAISSSFFGFALHSFPLFRS